MRITAFALFLLPAVPVIPALAVIGGTSGCAPINFASFDPIGTGAGGASSSGGIGGSSVEFDAGGTSTAATGGGGHDAIMPVSYSWLCGGSQPGCSTDPTQASCAPGGDPGMGGGSADASTRTCQLISSGDVIQAVCGMAGLAGAGDVCTDATACQADLGCVDTGVADVAVCQQYCCGDPEACPASTYCLPMPLVGTQEPIPVCGPVTPCELLNDAAHCQPGQTCAIVRNDGTTTCMDIGPGKANDACPCAAGYTCAKATNTCLQLCHVGSDECGPGVTCNGGAKPYPIDIGFCVPL